MKNHPGARELGLLAVATLLAVLVHGYHPGVEDAEIYLPGIKQALNPGLYPRNASFFASHAHLTLFPNLIAASARLSHLPIDWVLLLWHAGSIFLLLLGCWHLGRLAFPGVLARWGSVSLVAAVLTIPVAGTALYIMDQYLNTRSLSTPAVLFMVVNSVEKKFVRALAWAAFTALIHPLMVVFGMAYVLAFLLLDRVGSGAGYAATAAGLIAFPLGLFPPVTEAYREVLNSRPYFFLQRWEWYEWLGIFAPLALLWWYRSIARKKSWIVPERMCAALVIFGAIFFLAALIVSLVPGLANFAELQPMRNLHLVYLMFFVFSGGLLAEWVLSNRIWRWLLLFVPLCGGMAYAQWRIFPATPHLEWPGTDPGNEWVRAFLWIRHNTPRDAYFALDPQYMALAGEDEHGFRALAERSRLADGVKDSGAVSMFPAMAEAWREQVRAQQEWRKFQLADFQALKRRFGIDWIVLQQPGLAGLPCPYQNSAVQVCRL
ncbi:MAG TPA: hypothetical protein VGF08_00500, partial [Terriglobales bacterium]